MRAAHRHTRRNLIAHLAPLAVLLALGCGSSDVSSKDDARRAYLGLDGSVDKAIDLGFKGFNDARSANIPSESTAGTMKGTLTVTGQVDQGASNNKQMRLVVAMAAYEDVAGFTYDSDVGADAGTMAPALSLSLQGIPNGTLSGSLDGTFRMSGDLSGPVTLALTFTGDLEPSTDGGASGGVVRKPGTTHITGTATSPAGTFAVDVTK
jgi:hypothetical protein